MASHGKGSKIFVAGYDFSGQGRSIDLAVDVDVVDASSYDSTATENIAGQKGSTVDFKATFTNNASGLDAWYYNALGNQSGQAISILPTEPVEGAVAYNGEIKNSKQKRPVSIGSIVGIEGNMQTHGALGRGQIVAYEQTTARGTYVGSGHPSESLSSTDDRLVTFHVNTFTGTGNVTLAYQASTDLTSTNFSTISSVTFTSVGGAVFRVKGSSTNDCERVMATVNSGATAKYCVVASKVAKQGV